MRNVWACRRTIPALVASLWASWSAAAAAQYSEEAIATYQAAVTEYNAGNLERAIELFRESFEVHHGHPNALYNIGECYERLGNFEQAVAYYEQYLGTEQAEGRDEVVAKVRELRARKAVFSVRTTPDGATLTVHDSGGNLLADYPEQRTPCDVELPEGTFVLHINAAGYAMATQIVEGGLGRRSTIDVALTAVERPGGGPEEPFEPGRGYVGPYGGVVLHLNGASNLVASTGFGALGGYTLFDGDWRFDIGGDFCLEPYKIYDPAARQDYMSWFLQFTAVPGARWMVLPEFHLLASLGVGLGIFLRPGGNPDLVIPWAGNKLSGPVSILHFRPALGLEYLPATWFGIQLTPVAFDLDVPLPAGGTPAHRFLVRYAGFLAAVFHI
jgi:hypothetical protein